AAVHPAGRGQQQRPGGDGLGGVQVDVDQPAAGGAGQQPDVEGLAVGEQGGQVFGGGAQALPAVQRGGLAPAGARDGDRHAAQPQVVGGGGPGVGEHVSVAAAQVRTLLGSDGHAGRRANYCL